MTLTAHSPTGEHPTIQEEINRKVFDELERLVLHLSQGKINKGQFESSVNTLWNSVAGLCSSDLKNLISEIKANHCPREGVKPATTVVLNAPDGKLLVVDHRAGTGIVHTLRWEKDYLAPIINRFTFEDRTIPSKDAVEAVKALLTKAVRQGYRRTFA